MISWGRFTISKGFALFLLVFIAALILSFARANFSYTSPWDEHTHLSYVQYAWNWMVPANGYPMNTWAKDAFSCHPHAITGRMTAIPCGVDAAGKYYPTGGTNTSQAWPPVYFFLTALIMRPFQLFITDPLIAARFATAILWSLGVSFISLVVFTRSRRMLSAITTGLLLVGLPMFGYFSSFVSPHSMNALLAAGLLAVGFAWADAFRRPSWRPRLLWAGAFILSSLVAAATVPQSVTIVVTVSLFVTISVAVDKRRSIRERCVPLLLSVTAQMLACLACFGFYKFWLLQEVWRSIPVTASIDPALANVDAPPAVYHSVVDRVLARFWDFWPNALNPGFPVTLPIATLTAGWIFLLLSLSIAGVVFWRRRDWLSWLLASVLIAAPITSVLFDYIFTTAVPARYGLGVAILGVLAVNNRLIERWPARIIFALAALTYIAAFFIDPLFVSAGSCSLGANHLIDCVAP